ncbi:aminopeptidase P family protein [Bacteroides sp. 519]|uniref:aminopeptidase P family protein n=1 Tax=Bacteroides sp. 519 TaxID=2302937 RepID=UPI0013D204FC|nr:aminopeptidase P family protein [Bacteroides sp. 519]NDV60350.1 aminopeptidase P family protein [Bacteroides sp. 519]
MKETINNRIKSLRQILWREGLGAFIIPSTDPHMSEYVAPHWKSREWISGFTGSAGIIVVTLDNAGLWTDSRYFIQATEQLEGTGIDLYKEMLPETPDITTFLIQNLPEGSIVGIDGQVFAASEVEELEKKLAKQKIQVRTDLDPIQAIWTDRPPMPQAPAFIYEMKYAGKSCMDKVSEIREALTEQDCESTFLSALDEIAWTLNIRGNDVKCNPVVVSYLLITQNETVFFIAPEKLTPEVAQYLKEQQVTIWDYSETGKYLSSLNARNILINPAKTNNSILSAVNPACTIIRDASPVALLKAIRNEQEINGIHEAMRKDGVAMVKFLKWLNEAVTTGKETELSIDKKLHAFRAEQDLYVGESFDTIAGYGAHGAIVHYSATDASNATILPKGFLLLDSGAQYLDGTTDITRTIALGELTDEEKRDYTLVLKGHIDLAMAKFPAGTRGAQLDILARLPLWQNGMNFLHGTGHGIGHFLNVHEGPQSIRMNENPVVLRPGMLTSNEPGVYKAGSHGIRTENLILVVNDKEGMYGDYYKFETVTLCPICTKGIIKEMLSKEEIDWLNDYHKQVYDKISPSLNEEEKEWLLNATELC